ncbi:protein translocase subunit SecF [Pseudonocardia kunmingensis]|uniref:Protein-export membrane protein SecF n=1 Tax=Pseudonocardia kunmingensis TaxID=630975 RepID=A0A543D482_9PSEU|nr:protein translocase subunit SecF [Pseudonocardia kunmingensis]TQM04129.1 preprotein translocase subunit SecF [Pseudonocardia kunmingensis]
MAGVLTRLYTGTGAFDIVGRKKIWYIAFSALILVCIGSMVFRGFNLGIDFTGGTQIQFPATTAAAPADVESVRAVYERVIGVEAATVQSVGTGPSASVIIRSEALDPAQLFALKQALFDTFQPIGAAGTPAPEVISDSAVSGSWGGQITRQALIALAVFLVLVTVFLAFYFERSMAVAALVALLHDVIVTAGIYSLIGFEVTPSTVVGLLTILGFSLYDTVVVFDKVKENTRGLLGLTRRTYAEAANLALNQTLIRSINTSLFAVLPVLALMVIGVGLLGVGTLADFALVQLIGMTAGVISSLLLATPVLVDLKMRDPRFQQQAARVAARRKKAAAPDAGGADPDIGDDGVLATELRKERAMAAAASVPARRAPSGGGQHRGKRAAAQAPSGKAARPTGKRNR